MKWLYFALAGFVFIGGGIGLGMLVYEKKLQKPTAEFAYATDDIKKGGLATISEQIDRAEKEVLVACTKIQSEYILTAIKNASERLGGSHVFVILDSRSNRDMSKGALQFLVSNGVKNIYLSNEPLGDQFVVIDRQIIIETSVPWTNASANEQRSTISLLRHQGAATTKMKIFQSLLTDSRIVGASE